MPAIVEYPRVVREAVEVFGPVFVNEPEELHFADYITGLIVAPKKNVCAITREFAFTTDQSCLNRWLTQAPWEEQELNRKRLEWLQKDPSTRYHAQGVIALDNVLVDHEGKLIEDAGYYWDHADERYVIAQDYLIANYVCSSGAHYPLEFRRFVKREDATSRGVAFRDHNELLRELVDWCVQEGVPGDFTFDSYFTNAGNLNHIHQYERGYVGDLKFNRKLTFGGREVKASELAQQIPVEARKPLLIEGGGRIHGGEPKEGGDHKEGSKLKQQWYFTKTLRLPGVDHPVRILILWREQEAQGPVKILITNRTYWEVSRVLRVYRKRWSGTECFHRDGKQHLGMGDCQLRKGRGQTRHLYLVFLAYTILLRQMRHGRNQGSQAKAKPTGSGWAFERLMTIGQVKAAVLRETLAQTITWAIDRFKEEGWSSQTITSQLALS